jgi:hypothetical protein
LTTDNRPPIELSLPEALAVLATTARYGEPTGHEKRVIAVAHNMVRDAAREAVQREFVRTLPRTEAAAPSEREDR